VQFQAVLPFRFLDGLVFKSANRNKQHRIGRNEEPKHDAIKNVKVTTLVKQIQIRASPKKKDAEIMTTGS